MLFRSPNNYTLSIPGNGSVVIQIANPACYITSPCPLTLTWDICGGSSNWINVTHDIIFCDVCGIDCNGISITTGPFPSGTTTDQWRSLNPGPSWTSIPYSGCPFDMVQQTSNNSYIELESGSGCVSGQIVYILPNVQIDYSGLANNGDIVDIEYAFYSGHNWTIPPSYLALHIPFISGGATYVISGAVHPGTWYMGTITGVTFTYPGAAGTAQDGGSYSINITSATTPGEHAQIYYAGIRIRKQSQTYLIDPTDLNCSDMSLYNQTAIGDKKTITYHLNYINGFQDNTRLWFNPWIYSQTGDFAGQYFNGTINQEDRKSTRLNSSH